MAEDPIVELKSGCIRGSIEDNIFVFKGIPFAAPIDGHTRFLAPQPPPSWTGVRDTTQFGPTPTTKEYPPPFEQYLGHEVIIPGNEILNLNIWTPTLSKTGKDQHPVFVWIHGGAFLSGSGAMPLYNCSKFAKKGIVGVTINYRLGFEGFMWLKDEVCNRGLLDQIYALEWIRDNIHLFGGDPNLVTIAGESAGSISVANLMVMPKAKGLFKRAILQSGGGNLTLSLDVAQKVTKVFEEVSGLPATRTALENLPRSELNEFQAKISKSIVESPDHLGWLEQRKKSMILQPVVDGDTLPEYPPKVFASDHGLDVDVLVGNTTEEWILFLHGIGLAGKITDAFFNSLSMWGDIEKLKSIYLQEYPNSDLSYLFSAVTSDNMFRIPGLRVAESNARKGKKNKTFVYQFAWKTPLFGAAHTADMPFSFHALSVMPGVVGNDPPVSLADEMHKAWIDFIRDGDAGWPEYDLTDRKVKNFDLVSSVLNILSP